MVLSMERWKGKIAVVTGASSGIGAGIAEKLVEEGLKVVDLARRKERLDEMAKKLEGKVGQFHSIQADITIEEDILQAFQWISNNLGHVSILINNAGIGRQTTLVDGPTEEWRKIIDTNVLGLCICTREAVKIMRAHDIDGHIIHINSILGHMNLPVPNLNVYPASKYAVTALTETLRRELVQLKTRIKVTSISPGTVESEIFAANGFVIPEDFQQYLKNAMKPEDLADAVQYVLSTPPHVQITEMIMRPVGDQL